MDGLPADWNSSIPPLKNDLDTPAKRNQEIDERFMRLYAQMQTVTGKLRIASSVERDVGRFIGETWEYASITELDEAILKRLIDKIYISAVEVTRCEVIQKVRIVYNFTGEIAN